MRSAVGPLLLGLALISPRVQAGDAIRHYELEAEILPDGARLRARATITVVAGEDGLTRIDTELNRGLAVRSATCDAGVRTFRFDRCEASPYRYAPTAAPLRGEPDRPLEKGESARLVLDYEGTIEPHPWGVNALGGDWVELGLYSAWLSARPRLHAPCLRGATESGRPVRGVRGHGVGLGRARPGRLALDPGPSDR
jgi:hypothetical protein